MEKTGGEVMLDKMQKDDVSIGTTYNVCIGAWGDDFKGYQILHHLAFRGMLEGTDDKACYFRVGGNMTKVVHENIMWMIPVDKQ